MPSRKSDAGSLQLIGWSFASAPRRTLAKLCDKAGATTYIGVQHLVTAPDLFGRLSGEDQAKVQAMLMGVPA